MKKPISAFLKFGKLEHLEELRRGILYMQPLSYFQNLESDKANRADRNEGLQSILQPDRIQLSIGINGTIHELKDLAGPVLIASKGLADVHAFCTFALGIGEYEVEDQEYEGGYLKLKFDSSHGEFGGHVLCLSAGQFVERVHAVLKEQRISARMALVEYIKESEFHGDLPKEKVGFFKLDKFAYQREYRVVVYNSGSPNAPIRIDVGDLSDISQIETFENLDVKIQKNAGELSPA